MLSLVNQVSDQFLTLNMKILHVVVNLKPSHGGPPRAVMGMCKALANHGHDVSIFTTDISDNGRVDFPNGKPINTDGYKIYYYSYGIIRKYPISFSLAIALKENIRQFDIVHIHGLYAFHTIITAYYCRKFNTPYIIRPQGSLDPYLRNKSKTRKFLFHKLFLDYAINQANAVHYTAIDEKIKAHDALGYRTNTFILGLGIDLDEFNQLPVKNYFRRKYQLPLNQPIILFLGRINFKKGFDLLAKAFGKVLSAYPQAKLFIAGPEDPGFGDVVRNWLIENNAMENTVFTGMLLGKEKLAAYVDADIFVLPSYAENFGITLAEAMACRLPIITTNQVNIWQEIHEAKAGDVISCNPDELSHSILKLLSNPDLRYKYAENGRKLVEEKFNWELVGEKLSNQYENLINHL